MCKVIAVANQKGGVGKTVTCVNLGIGLVREGKKVLLIDADPQGSLTISLGFSEPDKMENTLSTVLMKIINDEEIAQESSILNHNEGVDLLPGNIELSGMEVSLIGVISREMILKEFVDRARDFYDYIVIDCMPSLGILTVNALACADSVLIPVQAAYLPVKGLQQLIKTIGRVDVYKIDLNPENAKYRTWRETQINSSGGEKLVSYFALILSLLNYSRSDYGDINDKNLTSVLILDNPFGAVSSGHLLQPMFEIANHFRVQLICLSDLNKADITACFDNFIKATVKPLKYSSIEMLTHEGNEAIEHGFYRSEQMSFLS